MKKDIHPSNYREVCFKDMSNEEVFITRSTVASRETIEIDGKEYPLVKLEITSSSHPVSRNSSTPQDASISSAAVTATVRRSKKGTDMATQCGKDRQDSFPHYLCFYCFIVGVLSFFIAL
jgi:ribosomal protein L31